jgi:hypothetical protein
MLTPGVLASARLALLESTIGLLRSEVELQSRWRQWKWPQSAWDRADPVGTKCHVCSRTRFCQTQQSEPGEEPVEELVATKVRLDWPVAPVVAARLVANSRKKRRGSMQAWDLMCLVTHSVTWPVM